MKKIYLHGAKNQIARHNTIRDVNKQIIPNYVGDSPTVLGSLSLVLARKFAVAS